MAESPKVLIALPAYGQMVIGPTVESLLATCAVLGPALGGFRTFSGSDIADLRNVFISLWYYHFRTSHMLFVDADMRWPAQLILDMLALDKPLVGAFCPLKKLPLEFTGVPRMGESKLIHGFAEVDRVGTGIMLINREVVTAILAKWPELETSDPGIVRRYSQLEIHGVTRFLTVFDKFAHDHGRDRGEDYAFCRRWKECGGEIWANLVHPIGHFGLQEFKGSFAGDYAGPTDHAVLERVGEMARVRPACVG